MGRGRYWTEEHDRLLLMYKYLTRFTYPQIAQILRARYPWCSISNQDIRGRLRRKTQQRNQGAQTVSLQDWPFSKALKMGSDLNGQNSRDVADFLDNTVDEADLNGMGRHFLDALHQDREATLQEEISFPNWMRDTPIDEVPSLPLQVEELQPLTEPASSLTYPNALPQDPPLTEPAPHLTYANAFSQNPPPPSQFANDPSLTPALVGTPTQIQVVASGTLNVREFFVQTQGNNIVTRSNFNSSGGNNNSNSISQASLLSQGRIAITIDQVDNLYCKQISYEQLMDDAQRNILVCVPFETVPGCYRIMVMTGIDPRFTVNRTPSPPRIQLPRHWRVGKEDSGREEGFGFDIEI